MINAKELLQLNEHFNTEEDYRNSDAVSYSTLKEINNDPNILVYPKHYSQKKYLDLGTIVDVLLTEPENLPKKIFVTDYPLPNDNIKKMVEILVHELDKDIYDIVEADAVDLFKRIKYQARWLPATKLKTLKEEGSRYYTTVRYAGDKLIIHKSLFQEAQLLAIQAKTYPWILKYFQKKDIVTQYKIKVKYDKVDIKCMLDILFIDNKVKTITPIDIKTGSLHPKAFMINYNKYKYYYQGALYKESLVKFIRTNIKELADYTITPFKFIFISTINFLYPTIWNITANKHYSILQGYNDSYGNTIRGLTDLIQDVSIYKKQIELSPHNSLVPVDLQETKGQTDIKE
jgi:hypothetical protein